MCLMLLAIFSVFYVIFTFEEPFKLLSKTQADDIIRRAKEEVREATPEELAFFYGVDL